MCHLDPWHPDLECQTFDIERNIRYRRLRYRMLVRYRRFLHSISFIDIEGVRYRTSLYSISKLKNRRYRRSRTGLSISKFCLFDIEHNYSISCSDIAYDIEGLFHVRYRIYKYIFVRYRTTEYRDRYRIRYSIHPNVIHCGAEAPFA
jgi:hypothetical protein